jgi:hypothetical protein
MELGMRKSLISLFLGMIVVSFFIPVSDSYGVTDPCYSQEQLLRRTDQNVIIAQNNLERTTANAFNVQNSLSITIANLEARVVEARALADAAGATAAGNIGGCAIGSIFGFGRIGGCVGRGIANGVAQRSRAQAAVRGAEGRLVSFTVYAANRNRREQQRVVNAQLQLERREEERRVAFELLQQCRVRTAVATNISS